MGIQVYRVIQAVLGFSIAAAATLAIPVAATASPLSATDGSFADWNITIADNNGGTLSGKTAQSNGGPPPSYWSGVDGLLGYHIEDQDDNAGLGGYLGPRHGGQKYDAEFMGVAVQGGKLFIGISTGVRPDNANSDSRLYSPGDIKLVADTGEVWGIEVGGGAPGNTGAAIDNTADGSTYTVNGSGYTVGYASLGDQKAGSLWKGSDIDWIANPSTTSYPSIQFEKKAGASQLGTVDYYYSRNAFTEQHAFIEVGIDLAYLSGASILDIYWAPGCWNDFMHVTDDIPKIPEPTTLALFGLGLAGLGFAHRRRKTAS